MFLLSFTRVEMCGGVPGEMKSYYLDMSSDPKRLSAVTTLLFSMLRSVRKMGYGRTEDEESTPLCSALLALIQEFKDGGVDIPPELPVSVINRLQKTEEPIDQIVQWFLREVRRA